MLPPIFGVSWGMYAVIGALVVLLIVLLVLSSRRRRKTKASAGADAKSTPKQSAGKRPHRADKAARYAELRQAADAAPAAETTAAAPVAAPLVAAAAVAPVAESAISPAVLPQPAQDLPQEALPPLGYVPAEPPHAHSLPMQDILPGGDPLHGVIVDLLSGWGDLTQEDTNRLGVFRPERVQAAVAGMEIPKELKNSEFARTRLSQLKRWASGLDTDETRAAQMSRPAQPEFAGIAASPQAAAPAPAAAPITAAPVVPAPVVPAPVPSFFEPLVAAAVVAPLLSEPAPDAPAPVEAPVTAPPVEAPVAPTPWPDALVDIPPAPTPEMIPQPPVAPSWQPDMDDVTRSTEAAIAAAAAAFWARHELAGTLPPAEPAAPQTAPAQPEATTPAFLPIGQDLPTLDFRTPVVEAPSFAPLEPAATPAPASGSASDTFMADLGGRVTTAEDLLALPPADQISMLAFLKPSELARVFQAADNSGLKLAVIETLESVGGPSALDLIHRCLDDADPQVQARALEAADRLLGAE
jgi:hypothetical protein